MKTNAAARTFSTSWIAFGLVGASGLAIFAGGCGQSEAAPQRAALTEKPAAVSEGAKSKVEDDVYRLEMKPTGTYKSGQEGAVEVTLVPKGDYHINDKYPIKFKVAEPAAEGVTYPKPLLKREDGAVDEKKGVFKIPFVAAKKGQTKVAGVLSFSMCNPGQCLMQKQDLEAVVDVQ
jgi:hypothetical protein